MHRIVFSFFIGTKVSLVNELNNKRISYFNLIIIDFFDLGIIEKISLTILQR